MFKISKQSLQWINNCEVAPFRVPNYPFAPNKNLFGQAINTICTNLLAFFIVKNLEPIQSYENVPFSGPKWPICLEEIFFL